MSEAPATRASLLVRLKDPSDQAAWTRFVEVYAPVIYHYGRRHGLQDADAADLTQDVFRTVARTIGEFRYDPRRGSFRGWLFTVARTRRLDLRAREARQVRGGGGSGPLRLWEEVPARGEADDEAAEWARAADQRALDWAAERVRAESGERAWLAFWRTTFEGAGVPVVAADLGMSVGAVYTTKCRVMARFRKAVRAALFDDAPA